MQYFLATYEIIDGEHAYESAVIFAAKSAEDAYNMAEMEEYTPEVSCERSGARGANLERPGPRPPLAANTGGGRPPPRRVSREALRAGSASGLHPALPLAPLHPRLSALDFFPRAFSHLCYDGVAYTDGGQAPGKEGTGWTLSRS